jgi:two-component system chemotaxis response regulator CheY
MADQRIIIVDDSPLIHNMLRKALEKNGYTVIGDAKNGKEAVEMYEELHPDCVFMDVTMPIMDGMTASKQIKEKYPSSRIIMLTAMGDDEIINEAKSTGIDVFLKKPFNEYNVISALVSIFD